VKDCRVEETKDDEDGETVDKDDEEDDDDESGFWQLFGKVCLFVRKDNEGIITHRFTSD